jgi:hypothetical protein
MVTIQYQRVGAGAAFPQHWCTLSSKLLVSTAKTSIQNGIAAFAVRYVSRQKLFNIFIYKNYLLFTF